MFTVNDVAPGFGDVKLDAAGKVKVTAKVAFAKDVALGTAPRCASSRPANTRKLELIVNGQVAASKDIPADDKERPDVTFDLQVDKEFVGGDSGTSRRCTPTR